MLVLGALPVSRAGAEQLDQETDHEHEHDGGRTAGVYGARTRNLRRDRAAL